MPVIRCETHQVTYDGDLFDICPVCETVSDLGDDVPRAAGRSDDGGKGERIGLGGHPRQVQAGRAAREAGCFWRST